MFGCVWQPIINEDDDDDDVQVDSRLLIFVEFSNFHAETTASVKNNKDSAVHRNSNDIALN